MRGWILRGLALAGIAAALLAGHRAGGFDATTQAIASLGPFAAPVFVLVHMVSVAAFVPSVAPALAAGALFGLAPGLPLSVLGAGLGAVLALGIGRSFLREWTLRRFSHDPRFQALSRLTRERGARIVVLARLSPLFPFSLGNYAFGATPIRPRDYLLASMLGTLPSNAVYVYFGSLAGEVVGVAPAQDRSSAEWALWALGLAATIALFVYVRRLATRSLERP